MGEYRETVSISLYPNHKKILAIWQNETQLGVSEVVRLLIENFSDHRFKRDGLFGWQFKGPAFQEEQEE